MKKKMKKDIVWMRKSDAQLGYAILETIFGSPVWLFAEHGEHETLSSRFCVFLEDPRDGNIQRDEFIDLGVL